VKKRPILYVIAGSNGAGKTTFATEFFPRYVGKVDFINADLIAQGLSPFHPERAATHAGRVVLERIAHLSARRVTFAIETTLAGRSYARMLWRLRKSGYRIEIYYLWIPNYRLALQRIKARVKRGGHKIAPTVVRRRFARTLRNFFHLYFELADYLLILDNSGAQPQEIAEKRRGRVKVYNRELFQRMRMESGHDEA